MEAKVIDVMGTDLTVVNAARVSFAKEHKVFRLGDIVNTNIKDIFSIIEEGGFKVGAIMPMNTKNNLNAPGYFIPDAWTKTSTDKSFWSKILSKCLTQIILDNSRVIGSDIFFVFIPDFFINLVYANDDNFELEIVPSNAKNFVYFFRSLDILLWTPRVAL